MKGRRRRRRKPTASVTPCIDCGRLTAYERCQRCESAEAERQAQEDHNR